MSAVADKLVVRCQDHSSYRGLEPPDRDCASCWTVHLTRGATVGLPARFGGRHVVRVGSAGCPPPESSQGAE